MSGPYGERSAGGADSAGDRIHKVGDEATGVVPVKSAAAAPSRVPEPLIPPPTPIRTADLPVLAADSPAALVTPGLAPTGSHLRVLAWILGLVALIGAAVVGVTAGDRSSDEGRRSAPRHNVAAVIVECWSPLWGAGEGGSCAVYPRTQPFVDAPRLPGFLEYPLKDGDHLALECWITGGEARISTRPPSTAWFRLGDGSYIPSVYTDTPLLEVASC